MFRTKRNETIAQAIYTYQKVFVLSTPATAVSAISHLSFTQASEFTLLANSLRDYVLKEISYGLSYREFYLPDFVRRADEFDIFFASLSGGEIDENHPFTQILSADLVKSAVAIEELQNEWGIPAAKAYKYYYTFRGEAAITVAEAMRDAKKIILPNLEKYDVITDTDNIHADLIYWFSKQILHSKYSENIQKMLDEVITIDYLNSLIEAKATLVTEHFFEDNEREAIYEVLESLTPAQVLKLPNLLRDIKLSAFLLLQSPPGQQRSTFRETLLSYVYKPAPDNDSMLTLEEFSREVLEKIIPVQSKFMTVLLQMPIIIGRDNIRSLEPPILTQNSDEFSRAFNILAQGNSLSSQHFSFQTLPGQAANTSLLTSILEIALIALAGGIALQIANKYFLQPLLAPHRRNVNQLFSSRQLLLPTHSGDMLLSETMDITKNKPHDHDAKGIRNRHSRSF